MSGQIGWGIQLQRGEGDDPETATFANIDCTTDLKGPSGTRDTVDVTCHQSPNATVEKIPGLLDWGEVTFDLNLDTKDPMIATLLDDLKGLDSRSWRILLDFEEDPGDHIDFVALVTKFELNFPVKDARQASLTLAVTGDVDIVAEAA